MKINYEDFAVTDCGVCKNEIELFGKYEDINNLMVCESCCIELELEEEKNV